MRCNNCGWNNPDDATRCEKCNAPLSGSMVDGNEKKQQPREESNSGEDVEKTIAGEAAEGPFIDEDHLDAEKKQKMEKCPHCGYPVGEGYDICPYCKKSLKVDEEPGRPRRHQHVSYKSCPHCKANVEETAKFCPYCGYSFETAAEDNSSGTENKFCPDCGERVKKDANFCTACGHSFKEEKTKAGDKRQKNTDGKQKQVNPQKTVMWDPQIGVNTFTLEVLTYSNEDLENELDFQANEDDIVLNRNNLDPNNNTITSKQQAIIEFSNGKWYITDKSSLKTTFIRPGEPTPIQDGDIIVMGNRKFRFRLND